MNVGEYFFCPRCGQALQNGMAYCPACGLPLTFPAGDLPSCPPPRKNSSNCLAVTSLVLGICSILSCLLLLIDSVGGFFCFNSIPLGAAGVALGIIARGEIRSRDPRGSTALATGGMVCSIIGLCIGVLLVLLSIATLAVLDRFSQIEGNTAQRASGDFARHLLANFPSYFTKMLVNTSSIHSAFCFI